MKRIFRNVYLDAAAPFANYNETRGAVTQYIYEQQSCGLFQVSKRRSVYQHNGSGSHKGE